MRVAAAQSSEPGTQAASDSTRIDSAPEAPLSTSVALHALAWLAVTCVVGAAMSLLLLAPELGAYLVPFTYGRWAALHLDLGLYGWLSVPLLGLLFVAYEVPAAWGRAGLALWSGTLVAGAATWLAGGSSGKLFLDWSGGAAWLFTAAQVALAVLLAAALVRSSRANRPRPRLGLALRAVGLAALLGVPLALLFGAARTSYPPIDPASGGPTGPSLLLSTLALVGLVLLVPRLAGLPRRSRGGDGPLALIWLAHVAVGLALGAADRSNAVASDQLVVASTALWAWLVPRDLARFAWPAGARAWLVAIAAWGGVVVATGVGQFFPEPLARLKFTHGLVAHAHAAMAGFASSLAALVLHLGSARDGVPSVLADRCAFRLWQGGNAAHVALLGVLGAFEAADPAALLRGGAAVEALLAARLGAAVAMLAAVLAWLRSLAPAYERAR